MNVPPLEFWVAHFINQHFEWYHMVPLVMSFFLAQFVAIPYFYFTVIREGTAAIIQAGASFRDFGNTADRYAFALEHTDASSTVLFEHYQCRYRYWFFVEWLYELLNFLFVTVAERFDRRIYWGAVGMRILYISTHVVLRSSQYWFHNVIAVVAGCAQLVMDGAVNQDI
jgi:hypothetical protein